MSEVLSPIVTKEDFKFSTEEAVAQFVYDVFVRKMAPAGMSQDRRCSYSGGWTGCAVGCLFDYQKQLALDEWRSDIVSLVRMGVVKLPDNVSEGFMKALQVWHDRYVAHPNYDQHGRHLRFPFLDLITKPVEFPEL